jgi:hypothetical protein
MQRTHALDHPLQAVESGAQRAIYIAVMLPCEMIRANVQVVSGQLHIHSDRERRIVSILFLGCFDDAPSVMPSSV